MGYSRTFDLHFYISVVCTLSSLLSSGEHISCPRHMFPSFTQNNIRKISLSPQPTGAAGFKLEGATEPPRRQVCEDMDSWVHPQKLWFSRCWVDNCLSNKLPSHADTAGPDGEGPNSETPESTACSHIYPVHHYLMTYSMQEFPYPWEFKKSPGNTVLGSPSLKLKCTIKTQRHSIVKNKTQPASFLRVSPGFPKILANATYFFQNPY